MVFRLYQVIDREAIFRRKFTRENTARRWCSRIKGSYVVTSEDGISENRALCSNGVLVDRCA